MSSNEVPEHLRDDEVAGRTSWEPLLPKGGANYRTRSANQVSDNRLTFDPSMTSKVVVWCVFGFTAICFLIGSVLTVLWLTGRIDVSGDGSIVRIVGPGFLVGSLFFGGGGVVLKRMLLNAIVFDRQAGRYWHGSETKAISLSEIYALQILDKWIKQAGPDAESYTSFELNLVTKDGQRRNVIDHCEYDALHEDANTLAGFLSMPVWDAVES